MPLTSPARRALLQLALCSAVAALAPLGSAVASEILAPIEQLHAGLIQIMKAGKTVSFRQRYATIAPIIGLTFDLEAILRQVIGPGWAALPVDQQAALWDAFKRYTIASYVANFDDYAGQRFEILPNVVAAGSDRVVRAKIVSSSERTHELAYVMRQISAGWRIVDVLVDGSISRVATQRSEVRSVLADGGGTGLLANLQRKTAELSGGILQ